MGRGKSPTFGENNFRIPSPPPQPSTSSGKMGRHQKKAPADLLRKPNIEAFNFSDQQEKDIAEWFRDNPILYEKSANTNKIRDKKRRLLEEKAAEIGCTADQLDNWLYNMRTRFGRLTKTKSGQAPTIKSDRDRWIVDSFGFLADHIKRQTGRSTGNVSIVQQFHNKIFIINLDCLMIVYMKYWAEFQDIILYISYM